MSPPSNSQYLHRVLQLPFTWTVQIGATKPLTQTSWTVVVALTNLDSFV